MAGWQHPKAFALAYAFLCSALPLHSIYLCPLCNRCFWRVDFCCFVLFRVLLSLSLYKRLIYSTLRRVVGEEMRTGDMIVCEHNILICIKIYQKKIKNRWVNDTTYRKTSYLCIVKRQIGNKAYKVKNCSGN